MQELDPTASIDVSRQFPTIYGLRASWHGRGPQVKTTFLHVPSYQSSIGAARAKILAEIELVIGRTPRVLGSDHYTNNTPFTAHAVQLDLTFDEHCQLCEKAGLENASIAERGSL